MYRTLGKSLTVEIDIDIDNIEVSTREYKFLLSTIV
jgi:hypothetical protein